MKNRWSLKVRLVLQFLIVGLIPMLCVAAISYFNSREALIHAARDKFDVLKSEKADGVTRYFGSMKSLISTFVEDKVVLDSARDFRNSFFSYADERKLGDVQIAEFRNTLKKYYTNDFAKEFAKQNDGLDADEDTKLNRLDRSGVALQHAFISQNSNPLGSKHKLDAPADSTTYSKTHAEVHPFFRSYLEEYGLYDVFLVDIATGHVIYSVFKELDFATSLTSGTYASTGIGKVFKMVADDPREGAVHFADFEQYAPSYMAPAGFLASPVFDKGKKIAVAIFQLPLDRITAVMTNRAGLGESGEVYLVGPDKLLRSDTYLGKENYTVVKSFRNPQSLNIAAPEVDLALSGKNESTFALNYLGQDVLTSYKSVDVFDKKWAIIAQIGLQESLAAVNNLMMLTVGLSLIVILLVALAGFQIARSIANPISEVVADLQFNASTLAGASNDLSKASNLISDQTTEQASAIEETAASIEEISAMVKNNVDQAEKSAVLSHQVENVAQSGKQSMDQLVHSMDEIIKSNEEISALVKLIGEIGDKTKIIDEIVFQTKLLSFNASVEAERAGEHGRGFAVVAQEVGNLAQMSGKAALEIASMVRESIKKAEVITSTSKTRVLGGHALVVESAKYLESIARDAKVLALQAEQIVTSSREQSDGIVQINEAMAQLDQTTQQNSQTVDETAAASEELNAQAGHLSDNVKSLLSFIAGDGKVGIDSLEVNIPRVDHEPEALEESEDSPAPRVITLHKKKANVPVTKEFDEVKAAVGEAIGRRITSVPTSEDSWDKL